MNSLQRLVTAFGLLICQGMKNLIYSFLALVLLASNAFAYSEETHKYETDIMLNYAGIHPAIAETLSNYAQHADDSRLNSALNPILFLHMRVSRLQHFPTEGVDPAQALIEKLEAHEASSAGHGDIQNIYGRAKRNSLMANEMFNEAIKIGNPFLIGAALHVLMDSYAHEGFNYVIGHGDRGHYPDRPWMFVKKHNEMRKTLFLAMTRLRKLLPEGSLSDIKVNKFGKLNRELTAEELFESYSTDPNVKEATEAIPHNDPLYTAEAVSIGVNQMIKQGGAKKELLDYVQSRRELFFEVQEDTGLPRDAWQITRELVTELLAMPKEQQEKLLNIEKFLARYGAVVGENHTYISKKTGEKIVIAKERLMKTDQISQAELVQNITESLIDRIVPRPAAGDDENESIPKSTMEDERLVEREARIQRSRWQEVRMKLFGLAPTLMIKKGEQKKIDKLLKETLGEDGSKLESDMAQLDKNLNQNQVLTQLTFKERMRFTMTMTKYMLGDFFMHRGTTLLTKLKLMKEPKGNLRLTNKDVEYAKDWQFEDVFDELKEHGIFQMILHPEQAQAIIADWNKRQEAFEPTLEEIKSGKKLSPLGQIYKLREEKSAGLILSCKDIFSN